MPKVICIEPVAIEGSPVAFDVGQEYDVAKAILDEHGYAFEVVKEKKPKAKKDASEADENK
tara:strand:+ start:1554 stop:1736 length:183 start_codon:yes stop_codon:yes gene_type:complete